MPVSFKYILYLLLLVIGCCPPMAGHAATGEKPILMICSYNPGAYPTSANVSDFCQCIRLYGRISEAGGQTGSGH